MKNILRILFTSLLLISLQSLFGQSSINSKVSIKGTVLDKNTHEPLLGANVFLSNTFIGTMTDSKGVFELKNIPLGLQTLVISMVGYENVTKQIHFTDRINSKHLRFNLETKAYELEQINVVTDKGDWQDYFEIFEREFIGEREFGDDCKIFNPYAIDFEYDEENKILNAYCDSLLIIENWALGYKLNISLKLFKWYLESNTKLGVFEHEVFFSYLTPEDEDQQEDWIENRKLAYLNSPRCFFKNLLSKELDRDKYYVRSVDLSGDESTIPRGYRIKKVHVLTDDKNNVYRIPLQYSLNVIILSGFRRHSSFLRFPNNELVLQKNGIPLNFDGNVVISGYWAEYRISDYLPFDYDPIKDGIGND